MEINGDKTNSYKYLIQYLTKNRMFLFFVITLSKLENIVSTKVVRDEITIVN